MTLEKAIAFAKEAQEFDTLPEVKDFFRLSQTALEAQREREHPKPLTWEELTAAKDTPVFIVDSKNHERYWSIVADDCGYPGIEGVYLYTFGVYNFLYEKDYGENWAAYRYEPKEV